MCSKIVTENVGDNTFTLKWFFWEYKLDILVYTILNKVSNIILYIPA